MFESFLFLGFKLDKDYSYQLTNLNPDLLNLYIHRGSEYLEEIDYCNQKYLGKFVDNPSEISALELTKSHIYSVLKKLVPNFPYENSELYLLPLIQSQTS